MKASNSPQVLSDASLTELAMDYLLNAEYCAIDNEFYRFAVDGLLENIDTETVRRPIDWESYLKTHFWIQREVLDYEGALVAVIPDHVDPSTYLAQYPNGTSIYVCVHPV
jgi:hypothetical protein